MRCLTFRSPDGEHPDLADKEGDALANALVFSGASDLVRDVMVAGRWVVREHHHAREEKAARGYARAVGELVGDG